MGTIFVDDKDLLVWLLDLHKGAQIYGKMQNSLNCWCELLIASGEAFELHKCDWYLIDYKCSIGVWEYIAMVNYEAEDTLARWINHANSPIGRLPVQKDPWCVCMSIRL